jgi:predicted ATPase
VPGDQANVTLIEGEAGIGKSRLLAEFRKRVAADDARVLVARGDRIEQDVPYHGWRDIYRQLLHVDRAEDLDARRNRVLQFLGAERADRSSLLNAVLEFEFPDSPPTLALSAQQRSAARLSLLLSLLGERAQGATVAVIIDDAHWLDAASWDLAHRVAVEVKGLCLILSLQPLQDETPLDRLTADGAQRLKLTELSTADQERLVCARLGVKHLAGEVTELVANRARGHPFFCMELAQTLLDEGVIEVINGVGRIASNVASNLPLPDTVHGTVTRRIDRLDTGPKLALKVASVAGLRFISSMVKDIYPISEERGEVAQHLISNSRIGLLVPESVDDMEGYSFRHGIIRDVVYELVLPGRRKQLHLQIAEWYERTFADQLSRHYSLIAYHLQAAEQSERAAHYLILEAQRTFSLGLARQSVTIGLRAAELFGIVLPTDPDGIRRKLAYELDRIAALLGDRCPADLLALAESEINIDPLLKLLVTIGPLAFQSEQVELFALIIGTALRLTLEHGKGPKAAEVYSMFSVVAGGLSGDRVKAGAWSRLALDLLGDSRDDRFGRAAFIQGWFHNHWVAPIRDSIALSRAGAEAALSHGDVMFGCFNLAACVIYIAAAGQPLSEVMQAARAHLARIDGRVMNASFHVKLELQVAKALAGLTESPFDLTDQEFDEGRDIASICDTELSNQTGYYLVSRAKLHVYLADWRGALGWIERARSLLPFFSGQTAEYELVQFHGLAALAEVAFSTSDNARALMEEGRDCIEKLRQWNDLSSMFGHKADLLAGIMECSLEPTEMATKLLRASAAAALGAGYLPDAALAIEFLARGYRKAGRHTESLRALNRALDVYAHWGANAKVEHLKNEFATGTGAVVQANQAEASSLPSKSAWACMSGPRARRST